MEQLVRIICFVALAQFLSSQTVDASRNRQGKFSKLCIILKKCAKFMIINVIENTIVLEYNK